MQSVKSVALLMGALCVGVPLGLAGQQYGTVSSSARPNELTDAERKAGWKLLFDGASLRGWRGLGYDSVPSAHWKVENGAIKKIPSGAVAKMPDGQPAQGGDLMTEGVRRLRVSWEWKVSPGANSGVKYNVPEQFSLSKASNHAALGFEYQILDDSLAE